MSTVVKDLGAVSAYAYAVEKGYTGTEAEFAELMADYAEVGQRAEDAAGSALNSKTAAQTAATTATNKASEATTAAQTATTAAEAAQADADAAALDASQALSAASTATTKATEATTAAATAVSAKDDAVSANTAAQSAKTAAQTAQTAAETAQGKAEDSADEIASSAAQIAQNTSDISELKEDLSQLDGAIYSTTEVDTPTLISDIPGINAKEGWNAANSATKIQMSQSASYDSYWFVTQSDVDVYFKSISSTYFAIVVGGQFTSTEDTGSMFYIYCEGGSTRYRKSDGNLPTGNNKIHIPAGCAVAFTITHGRMESIYGLDIETVKSIQPSFRNAVVKSPYFRYVSGSGSGHSTERIEVFTPTASGYVKYDFVHSVNASANTNVWRVDNAFSASDDFKTEYALTTAGEWECAVHLPDRSDFSGGDAHGDEVMTDIVFIVDGKPVDITTYTDMTAFSEISVIENSNIYDPDDSTTVYAKHGSEHYFSRDGLVIRQTLKFLSAVTLSTLYMAMLPIAKTVSDTLVLNDSYEVVTIGSRVAAGNANYALIYKTDGPVKAVFYVTDFEFFHKNTLSFLCLDNGGGDYNKCYYTNLLSSTPIEQGRVLKSETVYKFIVSAESN